MKLATLKRGGRDGTLVVVSRDQSRCQPAPGVAATLQQALDNWSLAAPLLAEVAAALDNGQARHAEPFDPTACLSPLPRAYQWADGSAFLNHVELVRRARGASLPEALLHDPLMYQGGSDGFVAPCGPIHADPAWGIDFEGEVGVITDDVALGAGPDEAAAAIRLLVLVNDVSLRKLVPGELAKGFGFLQSKPASSLSPLAVTPDELGDAWRDGRVHLPLNVDYNGRPFGRANAGAMHFGFGELIAHAARTRTLCAGSIVGSGTVSNRQSSIAASAIDAGGVGYSCLLELRTLEQIERGEAQTGFMQPGDRVRIDMRDALGASIFGAIDNRVADWPG